jgi:CRP-like cAMP-binding protein
MNSAAYGNQLLDGLDADERDALSLQLTPTSYAQGHVLFEPGDRIGQVVFPTAGVVSVLTVMKDGATVETTTVGRDGGVGIGAILGEPNAFSRAIWQIEGAGLRVDAGRLRDAVERLPKLRRRLEASMLEQLAEAQQSAACNALHKLEPRLAKWLLRCHDRMDGETIPLTQEFLSDMLGAQRTTVTAVAGALQTAGMIRYQRGRVEVLDRAALERVSCECYGAVRRRSKDLGFG